MEESVGTSADPKLQHGAATPQPQGTLRQAMPFTAGVVDWLRSELARALGDTELGRQAADRIVLRGKQGSGGFYAAERASDGTLREFGSTRDGARAAVVDGRVVVRR